MYQIGQNVYFRHSHAHQGNPLGDFCSVMFALGFSLESSRVGVETTFRRLVDGGSEQMSVTLHRPHGRSSATCSRVILSHYKTVLTHRFGWEAVDFVEE